MEFLAKIELMYGTARQQCVNIITKSFYFFNNIKNV